MIITCPMCQSENYANDNTTAPECWSCKHTGPFDSFLPKEPTEAGQSYREIDTVCELVPPGHWEEDDMQDDKE